VLTRLVLKGELRKVCQRWVDFVQPVENIMMWCYLFLILGVARANYNNSDLFELSPRNMPQVLDGRRVTVVAFVNPELPKSLSFHATLLELNTHFERRQRGPDATLRIAYADLNKHRSFVKRFEFKSVPSILAFPRGPNMDSSPIAIAYWDNKTVSDYRREIEVILAHCDGISSLHETLKDGVTDLTETVVERETHELSLASLKKKMKKKKMKKEVEMEDEALVQIESDGGTTNTSIIVDPIDVAAMKVEDVKNQTNMILREIQADIDTAIKILEIKKLKLDMLRALLIDVETNGTAPLARRLNIERSRALKQAASIPLDLEMVGETAEERLLSLAGVSLTLDVFETLNST
jgi:hypothetical protein